MSVVADILYFLIVLGLAVTIHEFGHFVLARIMGVRVLRFSIGFGKPLFTFKRGETEWCIAPIPLGGYVKMAGENIEDELQGEPWEFLSAPPWKRICIVFAGPAMNLVLAALIFAAIFFLVGSAFVGTRTLGEAIPGSLADQAGLRAGDEIVEINGEPIERWEDVQVALAEAVDEELDRVQIEYLRDGETLSTTIPVDLVPVEVAGEEVDILKQPPVIDFIDQAGPMWSTSMRTGDRIVAIDGKPVDYWHEVFNITASKIEYDEQGNPQPIPFAITWQSPAGETESATVTPMLIRRGGEVLPKVGMGSAEFGLVPNIEPVIGRVMGRSPAKEAGIKPGDRIVEMNGEPVDHAFEMQDIILRSYRFDSEGEPVAVPLEITLLSPENEVRTITVEPDINQTQLPTTIGLSSGKKAVFAMLGIQAKSDRERYGLFASLGMGVEKTVKWCGRLFELFGQLITREASGKLLGGPIAIFQGSAQQARWGAEQFFRWIAILSANLAIINLFPIPILDGGHIVIYLIEMVRRKRMSAKALEWAYRIAFFLILLPLIVMIFYVDLDRLGFFDPIKGLFD